MNHNFLQIYFIITAVIVGVLFFAYLLDKFVCYLNHRTLMYYYNDLYKIKEFKDRNNEKDNTLVCRIDSTLEKLNELVKKIPEELEKDK